MVHVHLKLLERFSKQHEHMFVRSRIRRKQKGKGKGVDEEPGSGEEDLAELSKNTMKERAFDYSRFETKFLTQSCTNTFLAFLGHYKELSYSQMKRAITFFHRIFVKRGEEVLLFRLDIVELFHRIMQDPDGLPASHPARKEMDQFVKHFLKKLFKKLETTPELYIELLFTKVSGTIHYLQHGYDKEAKVSKPRLALFLFSPRV
jgi:replication fork protection complex subunit Tof1/Swi1